MQRCSCFLRAYACIIDPSRRVCRPRGENSNYGLVRLNNEAYPELTQAFARVNKEAPKLHVRGQTEAKNGQETHGGARP